MGDDVAAGQLRADVLHGDALLRHEHQSVVAEIRDLVDGLCPVLGLGGDDDLGALLAHLFQDLVQALLEEVGGIAALGEGGLAVQKEVIEPLQLEFFLALTPDGVVEAAVVP